jgi:hypothetical protein
LPVLALAAADVRSPSACRISASVSVSGLSGSATLRSRLKRRVANHRLRALVEAQPLAPECQAGPVAQVLPRRELIEPLVGDADRKTRIAAFDGMADAVLLALLKNNTWLLSATESSRPTCRT